MSIIGMEASVPRPRVKVMLLDLVIFIGWLKSLQGDRALQIDGLPADARVVGSHIDPAQPNIVRVYLESAGFPEVPECIEPERLTVTIISITGGGFGNQRG